MDDSKKDSDFPPISKFDGKPSPGIPKRIPIIKDHEILRELGEGGMGLVYLAQQTTPIKRKIALKVIKPGMDSKQVIARFEAERQALANMNHPYIAQVYHAGMTDRGLPYFSMEYVEGVCITEYCDREKMSIDQRLELFLKVCQAIEHAHQKGVIHRDIKPSNILVQKIDNEHIPKIIDFGIAKAVSQPLTAYTLFTEQGQLIGTPQYMSPEQAQLSEHHIDIRSDVYSLGVLLYELLSGTLPFEKKTLQQAAFDEIRRIIREEEPPRPATRLSSLGKDAENIASNRQTELAALTKRLDRELEWIPLMAMRKDRRYRYRSASDLADDINNYLTGNPLAAGPESASYRIRKFIRRNQTTIKGVLVATVVLAVGITGLFFLPKKQEVIIQQLPKTTIDSGNGTKESPYEISTAEQLDKFGKWPSKWDKHFILTNDIDMTGYVYSTALIAPDTNVEDPNFNGTVFTGIFNGNNYTIENLTINSHISNCNHLGLFGMVVDKAEIINLNLKSVTIVSKGEKSSYIGGLCGRLYSAKITNCSVSGIITTGSLTEFVGGLCGDVFLGGISNSNTDCFVTCGTESGNIGGLCGRIWYANTAYNCYANGSVSVADKCYFVGGLAGIAYSNVDNCYATGNISCGTHARFIGGFFGSNSTTDNNLNTLNECYATGTVICGDNSGDVGGLCGQIFGVVDNCYATGNVLLGPGATLVGGLFGYIYKGHIINSYAAGYVAKEENSKDIAGFGGGCNACNNENFTACFWNSEINPELQGLGNLSADTVNGETTWNMMQQSTYKNAGWDFSTPIWKISNENKDYPQFN
jgi:serine/threonine protein kinase